MTSRSHNRKQHYVPASYLSHFATNPSAPLRKRKLWKVLQETVAHVNVRPQCRRSYTYSKDTEWEHKFWAPQETLLSNLPRWHAEGQLGSGRLSTTLLYQTAYEMLLRNIGYGLNEPGDRLTVIHKLLTESAAEQLTDRVRGYPCLPSSFDHLFVTDENEGFITSDNPAVMFSPGRRKGPRPNWPAALGMALSPRLWLLVYDRKRIPNAERGLKAAGEPLLHLLNSATAMVAVEKVYSPSQPRAVRGLQSHLRAGAANRAASPPSIGARQLLGPVVDIDALLRSSSTLW